MSKEILKKIKIPIDKIWTQAKIRNFYFMKK